jgi:hypothetical protein
MSNVSTEHAALKDGPRVVEELREEAKVLGVSWHAMRRAVKIVGAKVAYPGRTASGKHEWSLSSPAPSPGR